MATVYEYSTPPIKNTAFTFYISLISQADTDIFKKTVTLAAGDVTIHQDGGDAANIGSLPVEIGATGILSVALTNTEMNANSVVIRFSDASGAEWQDALVEIKTVVAVTPDINIASISGDSTAADNLEAMLDGTGGTTLTTAITGNITGDLSGSVGSVGTDGITAASLKTDAITEIQSGLATSASVAALNNLSAAQVNAEVVDALNVDTYPEPGQGAPPATASLADKIGYPYKTWRNKKTQTATTRSIYNDAGDTVDQKGTDSDDGTTYTKGEIGGGP